MESGGADDGGKGHPQHCSHWSVRFIDNWLLQCHQFTHPGEQPKPIADDKVEAVRDATHSSKPRPCQCLHCGAWFSDGWHLQRHQISNHSGQQPKPATDKKTEVVGEGHQDGGGKHCTHQSDGGKRRPCQCPDCGKGFADNWHLQRHQFTHGGQQPNPTSAGGEKMQTEDGSDDSGKPRPHNCNDCGSGFNDKWHLQRHQFNHTGGECDYCGKQFHQLDRLNTHRRLHTGEKPYDCQMCGYKGRTKEHVKRHAASKHSEERSFFCFQCGKTFKRKDHLAIHIFTHNPEKKQYKCSVCGQKFSTPYNLKQHMTKHSDERPFTCFQCGKAFKRKDKLYLHFFIHNPDKKRFKCSECAHTFSTLYKLKQHMTTHSDERRFFCEDCGLTFKRKDHLSLHLFTHNPDKKQYECSMCARKFSTPYNLKTHMIVHTDEKPFSCFQCGKRFKRKDKLTLHYFTHNPDKKPFTCSECTLKFSTPYKLKQHMIAHTGEKQFSCGQCNKAFKRKDKLSRHQLTHSSVKNGASNAAPCAACTHTCFQHQTVNQPAFSTSQPAYRQLNFQPVNLVHPQQKLFFTSNTVSSASTSKS